MRAVNVVRAVAALSLAAAVSGGGVALADSGAGPSLSVMPAGMRGQIAAAGAKEKREREALAAPAARAERLDSQTAFSGQSDAQAKDTLQDAFPAVAQADAYSSEGLVSKGDITQVTGPHTAQVALEDGKRGVLVSGLPLQAPDDSGAKQNVDATLQAQGDEYVPEQPLADYTVPKDLSDGIDLSAAGVTVTPQGPGVAAASAPQQVGDSLLWANTAADTDVMVTPTPTGVETFDQIRSQEAPESLPLDVSVPDGGKIAPSQQVPGALEVQNADGKAVADISPVSAADADGTPVPASYTIDADGTGISIQVPHREQDVHYPVLVDPSINVTEYFWDTGAHGVYPGWTYIGDTDFLAHLAGTGAWGDGMYIWIPAWTAVPLYQSGFWAFKAPGTSQVTGASFKTTYYGAAQHSCQAQGFLSSDAGAWTPGSSGVGDGSSPWILCSAFGAASYADVTDGQTAWTPTAGNYAAITFMADELNSPWVDPSASIDLLYMSQGAVTVEDDDLPQTAPANDFGNLHAGDPIGISTADNGTGVARVDISATDYPAWSGTQQNWYNCGTERAPYYGCTQFKPEGAAVGNLPSGPHTIRVAVWDAAGNTVVNYYPAYVNYPYTTSLAYGGADHSINTDDERTSLIGAMSTTADPPHLWTGVSPGDQAAFVNAVLPQTEDNRAGYGLSSDEPTVRAMLATPADQATIYADGAPLTPGEAAGIAATNAPPDETGFDTRFFTGGSPQPWFNRHGVVAWANANVEDESDQSGRHRQFWAFTGDDCTNFISQAWYFGGGLHMTSRWRMLAAGIGPGRQWTSTWSVADDFANYMVNTRHAATFHNVAPNAPTVGGVIGDAIEYDWGLNNRGWSHLALLVSTSASGDNLVDQHSEKRNNTSWRLGYLTGTTVNRSLMRTRVVHVTHG